MGIMEFDSIETGFAGTSGGAGEQGRQLSRQIANLRQMNVGHALAVAEVECLHLARVEDFLEFLAGQCWKPSADLQVSGVDPAERAAVARRDRQKLCEVPRWIWPPPDRQEIDDLNKQARLAAAGFA